MRWIEYKGSGYSFSDCGDVRNDKTKRMLKCHIEWHGYKRIKIVIDKKRKAFYVHRIVGELFIPNDDDTLEVDHINRNKLDNRVENLRWVTKKENAKNRDNSNIGRGSKLSKKRIEKVIKLYEEGLNIDSIYNELK